ncbi:MAG: hypothetical protein UV38_C0001G0273 [candidate division TM6 bacterium GW2011_GWE2_42_60]|nr:MAG: hypothetical protein UV38_C0001G0273 [candidate division TM6 bacterium GW2011_GWE2_42_60]HBY05534.1 hypothetical protein [Candidatus Dependentiae bacterium]
MRYIKYTFLFLVLGAGTTHFSYFNAMNTKENESNLKNEKLLALGKLDSDFRAVNGLSSPLLDKKKTMDTLKRIAVGPTYSHKKFFKNVSEGAEIYYGLASGLKELPTDQKTLYSWCRKVLSFVYASSFLQRASHDGPTDALFVIEDASVLKALFEAYSSTVLLGGGKSELDEKLVMELKSNKKLPKNRIELTGPDKNEGTLYGMRIHFRKTEEQSHRDLFLGRFKEIGYAVRDDASILLKFYGEKVSKDQAFINLSVVPSDCRDYFKANFGSEAVKLHGDSLMAMQTFVDKWMMDNPTKSDKASSFKKFLKQYAAKKRLTHLKKRTGNEIIINGKIELLVAAYLMQDPCVLAQNINESSSLIFDNKLSTEFSQVRGLFIMVQNLLDGLDKAYEKGFLENIQDGDEIPSSNDLNASVLSATNRDIGSLSFMMREYCACCSAVAPSLKNEGVKDYFVRAAMMIEKLLFDYKKYPRTVFEFQSFDSDSQIDFATQGIKSDVTNLIVEFYQKATKNLPNWQQDMKDTNNAILTWKDLVIHGIEETKEQLIPANSFRDVLKQVFNEKNLAEGLTDWSLFRERCAQLLTGGEKNERLMLLDTAIKNIIGHGDRSFVLDMQTFDSSIPGIFTQAAKKQQLFGNALLLSVLKQIRQEDACTGELRSKIEGTANSWKAYLGQLSTYFEKAGFYVSSGKKGSQLLEGVKLYVEQMVKKNMPDKSEKILPLLCGQLLQDKQRLYIAFGDDAFRNRILPAYQALTHQVPELKK